VCVCVCVLSACSLALQIEVSTRECSHAPQLPSTRLHTLNYTITLRGSSFRVSNCPPGVARPNWPLAFVPGRVPGRVCVHRQGMRQTWEAEFFKREHTRIHRGLPCLFSAMSVFRFRFFFLGSKLFEPVHCSRLWRSKAVRAPLCSRLWIYLSVSADHFVCGRPRVGVGMPRSSGPTGSSIGDDRVTTLLPGAARGRFNQQPPPAVTKGIHISQIFPTIYCTRPCARDIYQVNV
jgi:hypothetical protein